MQNVMLLILNLLLATGQEKCSVYYVPAGTQQEGPINDLNIKYEASAMGAAFDLISCHQLQKDISWLKANSSPIKSGIDESSINILIEKGETQILRVDENGICVHPDTSLQVSTKIAKMFVRKLLSQRVK